MSREELIAWIGLVLGIPGVIALVVRDGNISAGVFVIAIVAGLSWLAWAFNRPPFTLLEVRKTIKFSDPTGDVALFERIQSAKANQPATQFWCRGIGADGEIKNILIDGNPPDQEIEEMKIKRVCKNFSHPLRRGEEVTIEIRYDLLKSFPKKCESLIHEVDYPTKKLVLRVEFNQNKTCKAGRLFLRYSGSEKRLNDPRRTSVLLEAEINRPKIGAEYNLEWDW